MLASWGPLGTPLGALLGPLGGLLGRLFAVLGPSWAMLGPSGPTWGALRGRLRPPGTPLGALLGSLGGLLGRLLAVLGLSWAVLGPSGPSWGALRSLLGPPGAFWERLGALWGRLGPSRSARESAAPGGYDKILCYFETPKCLRSHAPSFAALLHYLPTCRKNIILDTPPRQRRLRSWGDDSDDLANRATQLKAFVGKNGKETSSGVWRSTDFPAS